MRPESAASSNCVVRLRRQTASLGCVVKLRRIISMPADSPCFPSGGAAMRRTSIVLAAALTALLASAVAKPARGQTIRQSNQAAERDGATSNALDNGIALPKPWPPREPLAAEPVTPPYLKSRPEVVPIDVGRQLLVDDFLVERTTLRRTFH